MTSGAPRRRVVVVGAGPSGLAAALRLVERDPDLDVQVLEASDAPGGWLRTEEHDDFVVELGPDAILTEKPAAMALIERLDLGSHVVRTQPERRGAYVVSEGRLKRVPHGFAVMAPTDPIAFLTSDVLSLRGRLRAELERWIPARKSQTEESLASFVRRRFGSELLDRLAQPMVSGIYGGDAEVLSLEATMPRFPAMEREHGSVIRALRKAPQANANASGARYGLFVAFDRGMQVLTDALVAKLGERVTTRAPVAAIEETSHGARVVREDGEAFECDAVILAVSAPRAARMLRGVDEGLASGLDSIAHGSCVTITFAFPRSAIPHPLDAYGFVVPVVERRRALASTWASAKWPGRAPAGWELIRVFLGGSADPGVAERDEDELVRTARLELKALMGIEAEPRFTRVVRYPRAMPIYRVGHRDVALSIEAAVARHPAIALAGNALRGVGIPDAIASGERAAETILERFAEERRAAS